MLTILAPLVRRLGYRSGSKHNIIREQSLKYLRSFLGRKNLKKDLALRDVADYILVADETVRWVLTALAALMLHSEEFNISEVWVFDTSGKFAAIISRFDSLNA